MAKHKSTSQAFDEGDDAAVLTAGPPTVTEILKGTAYALTIFTPQEISDLELFEKNGKPYITCAVSRKARPAKPEEIVRQLYLRKLMDVYLYPPQRIEVEKPVFFGSTVHDKAADIVIYESDESKVPYIIVEVKKPARRDGVEQLKSYCNAEGSPIGVWTNGGQTVVLSRQIHNTFRNLADIPKATQTLSQMLGEQWTIDDLTARNKLVHERTTLQGVILDMENLVLAGAGVDAFEEVFKLIFAKLYDEWNAQRPSKHPRYLDFRVGSATAKQFAEKVEDLFFKAKEHWRGVFTDGERINLEPAHLLVCGSFLEDIKLFNSNLQIIDEAFEYLSVKAAKGEKGQYFTPRHVIDMCVKMLNPTSDEFVIDTAAGSCGFTVHSIFHVWGQDEFTSIKPQQWQQDYASTHVYGLDFDPRSIKIARALNLIAGDGRTNVYRANTLDPKNWADDVRVGLKDRLRNVGNIQQDNWNWENYRHFNFDVLLTNPPFAGEIQDTRIIQQYDIAKNEKGKFPSKVGRDVLFIERNLEFLKPGGRAAIVLPQGRFNNSGDESLRHWIADRARILAVVGLHVNTFKPHTGTKTSVLFLQTWDEDKRSATYNPKRSDYPVFLATSENSGKDNSGDYVFQIGPDNSPLIDNHGHRIVKHDLGEIVEQFRKWGRSQRLRFAWRPIDAVLRDRSAQTIRTYIQIRSGVYTSAAAQLRAGLDKTGHPFGLFFDRIVHPPEFVRKYEDRPGHPFLRAQNVRPGKIEGTDAVYVSDAIYARGKDAVVRTGDILVVRTGANLGDAARVDDRWDKALISSHTLRLIPAPGCPTCAFGIFFCSPRGRQLLLGLRSGGTHGQINGRSLEKQNLPDLRPIEATIAKLTEQISMSRLTAEQKMAEAERALTEAIKLDHVDLSTTRSYSRKLSDLFSAHRFGAEYFMPAKERVLRTISSQPHYPLSEFFDSVRDAYPPPAVPGKASVRNFDLSDALVPFLDDSQPITDASLMGSTKKKIRHGDVVISRLRSYLRQIAVVHCSDETVCVGSSEFVVLRPKGNALAATTLLVYLRTSIVQTVLRWSQDGSNHPRFDEVDIMKIPVPHSVLDAESRINKLVNDSIRAQQQAHSRFATAIETVEQFVR